MKITGFLLALLSSMFAPQVEANGNKEGAFVFNRWNDLNAEIETLEREIEQGRNNALKKEMNAQVYMLDNWHQYAKTIEEEEKEERRIRQNEIRLKNLLEIREKFLKTNQNILNDK